MYRSAAQQVHVYATGELRPFQPFITTNILFGGLDEDNLLHFTQIILNHKI
jgi:hypothetical protein